MKTTVRNASFQEAFFVRLSESIKNYHLKDG